MKCVLCSEKEVVYDYVLDDDSSIGICEECGEIVYGKEFKPVVPKDRLFQIILMMEYVKAYKEYKHKILVKK